MDSLTDTYRIVTSNKNSFYKNKLSPSIGTCRRLLSNESLDYLQTKVALSQSVAREAKRTSSRSFCGEMENSIRLADFANV